MARSKTQKRLMAAALELFTAQGFNLTTTKQIADLAQVNEATLFRNFGGKHDLLLAVVAETGLLQASEALPDQIAQTETVSDSICLYVRDRLQLFLEQAALLRAVVGETEQYSLEQRQALQTTWQQIIQTMAAELQVLLAKEGGDRRASSEQLAALLNSLLLGYLMTQDATTNLWQTAEEFVNCLVDTGLYGVTSAIAPASNTAPSLEISNDAPLRVRDLPAELVRKILQRAKKQGAQPYAIAYLLFGAGLLPSELLQLRRSHHLCNPRQNLVQINQGAVRQVPINQWIMGKRYGSYSNNPLTQWLKSRKDEVSGLFINEDQQPLSETDFLELWETVTADLLTPDNTSPQPDQARQTWCVEMLAKGISPEDLSILSGWTIQQLQPYVQRTREKLALERAMQLDQKVT